MVWMFIYTVTQLNTDILKKFHCGAIMNNVLNFNLCSVPRHSHLRVCEPVLWLPGDVDHPGQLCVPRHDGAHQWGRVSWCTLLIRSNCHSKKDKNNGSSLFRGITAVVGSIKKNSPFYSFLLAVHPTTKTWSVDFYSKEHALCCTKIKNHSVLTGCVIIF